MKSFSHLASGDIWPLQWSFKDKLPNGTYAELQLRRVKTGNEKPSADTHDSGFGTHFKGSYSDVGTLFERVQDDAIPDDQSRWILGAVAACCGQMDALASSCPELLALFAPKGHIEIYGTAMPAFAPQYISGNHTLKLHVSAFSDSGFSCSLAHLLAQHLDFPFAKGERRFSSSRLFDLCFSSEKVIAPHGLAAAVDASLAERGIYLPDRHAADGAQHVRELLGGKAAAAASGYQRVLQRERFATLVAWWMTADDRARYPSPVLSHYRQLVVLDLAAHKQRRFLDYPPKTMDALAESIHLPLLSIFTEKRHARRA